MPSKETKTKKVQEEYLFDDEEDQEETILDDEEEVGFA